LNNLGK
jgi:Copine